MGLGWYQFLEANYLFGRCKIFPLSDLSFKFSQVK